MCIIQILFNNDRLFSQQIKFTYFGLYLLLNRLTITEIVSKYKCVLKHLTLIVESCHIDVQ